ncbi:MAG: nucleoside recognition domain-containing protein [Vampirovibrionia bacterium]
MMNYIWLFFIISALIIGAINGKIDDVTEAAFDSAGKAVTIAIGLIGLMAFWLGIMKIAEEADLIRLLSKAVKPIAIKLFPEIPSDHPAIGSMVMNISANMLGLGNAATPLGIKAMEDLESLNKHKGIATNAMCTFLAINTSSVQLIPIMSLAILKEVGYTNPTQIIGATLFATTISTAVAIISVKLLEKLPLFSIERAVKKEAEDA